MKLTIERQSFVKAKGQPYKHMTAVNVRLKNKVTQQHRKHLGAVHTTPEKSESKALFLSVLCEPGKTLKTRRSHHNEKISMVECFSNTNPKTGDGSVFQFLRRSVDVG